MISNIFAFTTYIYTHLYFRRIFLLCLQLFSLSVNFSSDCSATYTSSDAKSKKRRMWFFIIGIVAIFGLVYYWFVSKYKHFEELGIPFSKPKFPFGNLPSTITQNRNMTYDFDDMYQ